MKTSFTALAFLLAAGFPASLLAEFSGLALPTVLAPGTTFGLAVTALTLLTACSDYARLPSAFAAGPAASPLTAATPSAGTAREERRLAA